MVKGFSEQLCKIHITELNKPNLCQLALQTSDKIRYSALKQHQLLKIIDINRGSVRLARYENILLCVFHHSIFPLGSLMWSSKWLNFQTEPRKWKWSWKFLQKLCKCEFWGFLKFFFITSTFRLPFFLPKFDGLPGCSCFFSCGGSFLKERNKACLDCRFVFLKFLKYSAKPKPQTP